MQAKIVTLDGTEKGQAQLPDELFGQQINEHVLWLSLKRHLGNQRQGTAAVKNRALVSGGGKKPFKQKGTGRARQGSNTSPLMPGGGRAFGPRPRDYRTDLPKSQRHIALTSALSQKAVDNAITVIDGFTFSAPRTKTVAATLKSLGLATKRTLLVVHEQDDNVWKSCRNIANLRTSLAHQLNPYELIEAEAVLVTAQGLERMKEIFVR